MTERSAVAHQFEDAVQQHEAATLGMWVFLATEVLFFGAIFVAYSVYRLRWPSAFREGSLELKWYLGAVNTAILLGSSFFMALAVHAAQHEQTRALVRNLLLTIVLGACFLGIKGVEYYVEYGEGLLPGRHTFAVVKPTAGEQPKIARALEEFEHHVLPATSAAPVVRQPQERLFMAFYFMTTSIHAIHMLIGLGLLLTLAIAARRGKFTEGRHNTVEVVGLYWHFVDTVWVFLFPALYLLRFQ